MGSSVRGLACPRCFKILYTLERQDGESDWIHSGLPLSADENGPFIQCPECGTHVPHRRAGNVPGFGHEVGR
ncbi:MAG TPA: hypothetical protein VFB01_09260 [Burkholderiales bacterium]|jgi:DNA-directed RNA polymerase subunit RPC12/RpoP|nr:hypothetical protein [Burkholderiales bacterium]